MGSEYPWVGEYSWLVNTHYSVPTSLNAIESTLDSTVSTSDSEYLFRLPLTEGTYYPSSTVHMYILMYCRIQYTQCYVADCLTRASSAPSLCRNVCALCVCGVCGSSALPESHKEEDIGERRHST